VRIFQTNAENNIFLNVELPRNSTKQVLYYPTFHLYQSQIVIQSERGVFQSNELFYQYQTPILILSKNPEELRFFKDARITSLPGGGQESAIIQSGQPEEAPARFEAYRDFSAVILHSGSEQLTPETIEALIQYVIMGGQILFLGPETALALAAKEWQRVLPMRGITTVRVRGESMYPSDSTFRNQEFSLLSGERLPGTTQILKHGLLWKTQRFLGYGGVTIITASLEQSEFANVEDRLAPIRTALTERSDRIPPGPRVGTRSADLRFNQPTSQRDAFKFELPSTQFILTILVTFVLLAVPINFLLLGKLDKAPLAWITTPILSIIFAGILLWQTRPLYEGQAALNNYGNLIQLADSPHATLQGYTELFIPLAGQYPISFPGLLDLTQDDPPYLGQQSASGSKLEILDEGELQVKSIQVANLSFSDLGYSQRLVMNPLVSAQRVSSNGKAALRLTATRDLDESSVIRLGRETTIPVGPMTRGQAKTVPLPTRADNKRRSNAASSLTFQTNLSLEAAGPQITFPVKRKSQISYTLYLNPLLLGGDW
jgi:hypothetical protein